MCKGERRHIKVDALSKSHSAHYVHHEGCVALAVAITIAERVAITAG